MLGAIPLPDLRLHRLDGSYRIREPVEYSHRGACGQALLNAPGSFLALARGFMVPRPDCTFHVLFVFVELIPLWRYFPPPFPPPLPLGFIQLKNTSVSLKHRQFSTVPSVKTFQISGHVPLGIFGHTNLGLKLDPLHPLGPAPKILDCLPDLPMSPPERRLLQDRGWVLFTLYPQLLAWLLVYSRC